LTVNITATGQQRHSSVPVGVGAAGILAAALARLTATPQPGQLTGPLKDALDFLAPEARLFPYGLVYANTWLTKPLLESAMASSPYTDAILRTTTAVTILRAGERQ